MPHAANRGQRPTPPTTHGAQRPPHSAQRRARHAKLIAGLQTVSREITASSCSLELLPWQGSSPFARSGFRAVSQESSVGNPVLFTSL